MTSLRALGLVGFVVVGGLVGACGRPHMIRVDDPAQISPPQLGVAWRWRAWRRLESGLAVNAPAPGTPQEGAAQVTVRF